VFALRDKEKPHIKGLIDYYRTLDEALEARSKREMFSVHNPAGRDVPIPGEDYLEIVEVERESNPCRYCGAEVQASDSKIDYCRGCYYSGTSLEEGCRPALDLLDQIPGGKGATVWHTGGGCFALAVDFPDETYVMVTDGDAGVTDEDGLPLDPQQPVWMAGYYFDPEEQDCIELLPAAEGEPWGHSTIPEIVAAASALLAEPGRNERVAQQLEEMGGLAVAGGEAETYYREQAARLRARKET
jgi:hypothetical protein